MKSLLLSIAVAILFSCNKNKIKVEQDNSDSLSLGYGFMEAGNSYQSMPVTELKKRLTVTKSIRTRIPILENLVQDYLLVRQDSSIFFTNKLLIISKQINNKRLEGDALRFLGVSCIGIGNYPQSFEYLISALKVFENLKNSYEIANCNFELGFLYSEQDDNLKAILYGKKALSAFKNSKNNQRLGDCNLNLGSYYYNLDKLDSSLYYAQEAYQFYNKTNLKVKKENLAYALVLLGNLQDKYNQDAIATAYYRQGIIYSKESKDNVNLNFLYLGMANLFNKANQTDSSIFYGTMALQSGEKARLKGALEACRLLSGLFEKSNNPRAIIYYKKNIELRDSLFATQKIQRAQAYIFAEDARQQEIKQLLEKEDEQHKKDLQLAGIALFIPVFLVITLFLSRIKFRSKIIESMSILFLLFLFEFITLLIHPWIERFSFDSIILEFAILVLLSAFIIPLHHRSTEWLVEKLAHKHKSGRRKPVKLSAIKK